jgi:transcriptional regulator with XRE-family HTH domain
MCLILYHDRDYQVNTNVMQADGLITFVKNKEEQEPRTLGDRVRWARGQRKLSQQALGTLAKVSQGTIGNLESGARQQPRALIAIAKALRTNPDWLLTGKGDWEVARGAVFEVLTDEERDLLDNFRRLLDKDRHVMAEKVAALATERQEEADELFKRYGVTPMTERTANAARKAFARAAVEAGKPSLRQKALFDHDSSKKR